MHFLYIMTQDVILRGAKIFSRDLTKNMCLYHLKVLFVDGKVNIPAIPWPGRDSGYK